MLDSGFMPPFCSWARVTETSKGEGVLLLLRVKQRCLLHAIYLMQMSVACNLILMGDRLDSDPTVDFLDIDAVGLNGLFSLS